MKQIKDIKNKIEWEEYYDPSFNWNTAQLYKENIFSEDFIREFKNKVDWCYISIYQKLSEDFIREFQNKVDWCYISIYQKLSEDFIREFKNKIYWKHIANHQKLSEEFKEEFKKELRILFL